MKDLKLRLSVQKYRFSANSFFRVHGSFRGGEKFTSPGEILHEGSQIAAEQSKMAPFGQIPFLWEQCLSEEILHGANRARHPRDLSETREAIEATR